MPNISEFQLGIDGKAYIEKDDGTNTVVDLSESTSNLKDKIRNSIASAKQNNPVELAPWFKSVTWTANKTWVPGQIVVGTDTVNAYQCKDGGAGATSGSGPTGTGYGPITDGSATWYWCGTARGLSPAPGSPFVYHASAATWQALLPNRKTMQPTLTNPFAMYSGGLLDLASGVVEVRGTNYGTVASPSYTSTVPPGISMTFITDSRYIALESVNAVYANMGIVVEVNDRRVDEGGFHNQTSTVNPAAWVIDTSFTGIGQMNKIRIFSKDGFQYCGKNIHIDSSASLVFPENANRLKVAVEGDSLTQGGFGTPYKAGQDWVTQAMSLMGIDDFSNFGVGGTGFISTNGGTKTTFIQRLPRLVQTNADVYIIAGCHNDVGVVNGSIVTPSQRQEAILTYLRALRSAQPSSFIVLCGNNILRAEAYAPGSDQYMAEQDAKVAFDQFADPKSAFVPILTSKYGSWITGTGSVQSPTNSGNSDKFFSTADGHPLQRGVDYFAQRYFHALNSVFA